MVYIRTPELNMLNLSIKKDIFFNTYCYIMKKSILLLFAAVIFLACENTETNSIALQANLNTELFRAYSVAAQANNTDQMITIIGTSDHEQFTLYTEWKGEGLYEISHNSANYATFTGLNGKAYTTKSPGSLGHIIIETDDVDSQQLTGKFDFTFITATDTIAVNKGLFYAVPYEIVDIVAD